MEISRSRDASVRHTYDSALPFRCSRCSCSALAQCTLDVLFVHSLPFFFFSPPRVGLRGPLSSHRAPAALCQLLPHSSLCPLIIVCVLVILVLRTHRLFSSFVPLELACRAPSRPRCRWLFQYQAGARYGMVLYETLRFAAYV